MPPEPVASDVWFVETKQLDESSSDDAATDSDCGHEGDESYTDDGDTKSDGDDDLDSKYTFQGAASCMPCEAGEINSVQDSFTVYISGLIFRR